MEEEIKKTGEVTETDETVTEAEAVTNEVSADDTWFKRWKKKRAAKKEAQRKKDEAKGFWQNLTVTPYQEKLPFCVIECGTCDANDRFFLERRCSRREAAGCSPGTTGARLQQPDRTHPPCPVVPRHDPRRIPGEKPDRIPAETVRTHVT